MTNTTEDSSSQLLKSDALGRVRVTDLIGVTKFAGLGHSGLRRLAGLASAFAAGLPQCGQSVVMEAAIFHFVEATGFLPHRHPNGWISEVAPHLDRTGVITL